MLDLAAQPGAWPQKTLADSNWCNKLAGCGSWQSQPRSGDAQDQEANRTLRGNR